MRSRSIVLFSSVWCSSVSSCTGPDHAAPELEVRQLSLADPGSWECSIRATSFEMSY